MKLLRFFLTLMLGFFVATAVGPQLADYLGVSSAVGYVILGAASLLGGAPAGALGMAVTITTAYPGEVLDKLLTKATTGNQLVAGGHIRVEPNVQKKFYIPRLKTGAMLQKRIEQPVDSDSKGDFAITEKVLEPLEFMAFTTFNPRSFEKFWRPYQPTGELVFRDLPPQVQSAMLDELAKVVDFELGFHFIQGEAGAGATQFFNGIVTRIAADADVLPVATPVPITSTNIIAKLADVRALIPKAVRKSPNLKIFMSIDNADMYDDALTAQPNKGANYTDTNPERYKGIKIVPLADWPDDVIVAAVASMDLDTNFWAAVDFVNDFEAIKIDRLTNAGEKYFFKMLMKADTNIAFGEEIVLYDARV